MCVCGEREHHHKHWPPVEYQWETALTTSILILRCTSRLMARRDRLERREVVKKMEKAEADSTQTGSQADRDSRSKRNVAEMHQKS